MRSSVVSTSAQLMQRPEQEVKESPIRVFLKDEANAWVPAVILEKSKTEARCRLEETNAERTVKLKDYRGLELPRQNGIVATPDLVDMEHLHEAGILYNLQHRHANERPYTRSGDLVVSVNPFQWLSHLYTETNQKLYATQLVWQNSTTDPRQGLEPHIYEVSSLSYAELAFQGTNQSIIITGESGSGKTEATKLLMHHITSVQQGPSVQMTSMCTSFFPTPMKTTKTVNANNDIVQRILNADPLLEAFGNAATVRNDNSSRFGKYTQLQFDRGDPKLAAYNLRSQALCVLAGSHCEVYLLETSRVCFHSSLERTFHIFYQILASSDEWKAKIWDGLLGRTCADFKYIGTSTLASIEGISDAKKFLEVCTAFSQIGMSEDTILLLMRAICMVMQLGNIAFESDPAVDDKVVLKSPVDFQALSELMGICEDDLIKPFTVRNMTTRGETFQVRLSPSAANDACDALAKELYLRTFSWLVRSMNERTCAEKNSHHDPKTRGPLGVIGLLDIFGFESFATNGFGQLCINYANERLHQHAMNDIFRDTKAEYDFEGIPLFYVEVDDNEQVLDLIESRTGLISLLNEECYRPKGNDLAFVSKVLDIFKESKYIVKPKRGIVNQFGVAHYAGVVTYTAENFVESNQDALPFDLKEYANNCSNIIVCQGYFRVPVQEMEAENPVSDSSMTFDTSSFSSVSKKDNGRIAKAINPSSAAVSPSSNRAQIQKEDSPFSCAHQRSTKVESNMFDAKQDVKSATTDRKGKPFSNTSKSQEQATVHPKQLKRSPSNDLMAATVWTKYQDDLSSLLHRLRGNHCRYIRCIKPNPKKAPKICDRRSTAEQLRCAGIVSTVKLSRAIFANSLPNKLLALRYLSMWDKAAYPSKAKRMDKHERRVSLECESILSCTLQQLIVEKDGQTVLPFAVGKTKSYFRKGALEWLEAQRVLELDRVATVIEKLARGNLTRLRLARAAAAALTIQIFYRQWLHLKTRRLACSAIVIQRHIRGIQGRKHVSNILRAVPLLQKWSRKVVMRFAIARNERNRCAVLIQQWYLQVSKESRNERSRCAILIQQWYLQLSRQSKRMRIEAATKIQTIARSAIASRRWTKIRRSIPKLQEWYRRIAMKKTMAVPVIKRKRFLDARNVFERNNQSRPLQF